MGYTQYYPQHRDFTTDEWARFSEGVQRLIEASPVPLADGRGDAGTTPQVTRTHVSLNGVEDNSHETLYIPRVLKKAEYERDRDHAFHFCKTAYKPYDVIVTAVLCWADHVAPGALRISSDGEVSDWIAGRELARRVLGDTVEVPFSEDEEDGDDA